MKIAVISQSIQATLVAALNCYRAEVVKQGNAEYLAQLDQAMKVVEVSSTGPEIAQAASQLGIPFTDFVNHGYGVGSENCFVEVAPDMARQGNGPDLDFDDKSVVARSGSGAMVSCWLWVPNASAGIPEISDLLNDVLLHLEQQETCAAVESATLDHNVAVIDDLVDQFGEELDELCMSQEVLPDSFIHKVYNLGSGDVETFPSCILKELSAAAESTGFSPVKVGHLNDWILTNGRTLDYFVTTLSSAQ